MNPHFAVLRTGAEPLEWEQLERAFGAVPGLTPADAGIVCQDARGILVRGFEAGPANAFAEALKAEGVAVAVVEESTLPSLPPIKLVRRFEFAGDALEIHDLIGRKTAYPRNQVALLAAGRVREAVISRVRSEHQGISGARLAVAATFMVPMRIKTTQVQFDSHVSNEDVHRLDILMAGEAGRFSIEADKFFYTCLEDRVDGDAVGNFRKLVRRLAEFAVEAAQNSGVASILANEPKVAGYQRKNLFEDEMVWMLWWAAQQRG
jgi:hypothetical protein